MASSRKPTSSDFGARVFARLAAVAPRGAKIRLGLSGGHDSAVLLSVLCDLAATREYVLECMHVHHGISPWADDWAVFCAELCLSRNIKLDVVRVALSGISDTGIEKAARKARYAALLRDSPDFVVLAHHLSDQAETVFLQLLRGSGIKGLSAMAEPGAEDQVRIVRPMLGESYAEIRRYAIERRLSWVIDESNGDTRFTRNFVRHKVFPLLEERFPGVINAMARSASHLAEAQRLLDDLAAIDLAGLLCGSGLDMAKLTMLDDARARNVLRYYLAQSAIEMPQSVQLGELLRQIRSGRSDSLMSVNFGRVTAKGHKGVLRFEMRRALPKTCAEFPWHGEAPWLLPELGGAMTIEPTIGNGISVSKLAAAPVRARLRVGGEKIRLDEARPTRTLKNLLQEAEIPHWLRHGLPLVYCGDELVFVPGIGIAAGYRAGPEEKGLLMQWSEINLEG